MVSGFWSKYLTLTKFVERWQVNSAERSIVMFCGYYHTIAPLRGFAVGNFFKNAQRFVTKKNVIKLFPASGVGWKLVSDKPLV